MSKGRVAVGTYAEELDDDDDERVTADDIGEENVKNLMSRTDLDAAAARNLLVSSVEE